MRASSAKYGLVLVLALGLAACGGDMDELDQYINETKATPGGRIDPLPEITPYESFIYVADAEGMRSPFIPDTPQAAGPAAGGTRPDPERSREYLESFPLDTLGMVGTLDIGDTTYGLVQTADGLIHRVVPGNYLGQNDGRITGVTESEINLTEIISDGIGGYIERDAAIGLSD
ncbi:MAG: pilus assembly protein PilP [Gammaproteobacteria bacterium]|nr:pilus assembly protein PilP [Gammaproteobacteria bacterium]MBT8105795.1 pilus assembly protein PilP [Gammaproteobacteria bacterium]NNF50512.1 pilus assembly protein PilP [Woeseiaceae bacterium]NNK25809.1 pilus assembly protein PilP [Woeseiaceae bacterium]NNL62987.1 pilus assembly protein PilP [Woeseiaceae bacterium]